MSKHAAEPGLAQAVIELRRARIFAAVQRPLQPVGNGAAPLEPERIEYLCREAEDLYWEELAWEELTDEERIDGGHLTEMVFPAFLSFVDGLLLDRVSSGSRLPARPHPDVVEEVLVFLAERYTHFSAELKRGADSGRVVWARAMTSRLIDLVLYRLYHLSEREVEELEEDE